jgi:hypothetical protein
MAAPSSFQFKVSPHVPGCPPFLMDQEIVEAARTFCEDTLIWQDPPGSEQQLVPDGTLTIFPLTIAEGSEFVGISAVTRNGINLVDGKDFAADVQSDRIILTNAPAAIEVVKVKRIYKPAEKAASLPDFLLKKHCAPIAYLATSRLCLMKDKEWSDPRKAVLMDSLYMAEGQNTIAKALKGGTGASLTVFPRDFGF